MNTDEPTYELIEGIYVTSIENDMGELRSLNTVID